MIDSINPRNLLDFAIDLANWASTRPETLDDELKEVLRVIHTFCANQTDPIFEGAEIFSNIIIERLTEHSAVNAEEPYVDEQTEEEVKQQEVKKHGSKRS